MFLEKKSKKLLLWLAVFLASLMLLAAVFFLLALASSKPLSFLAFMGLSLTVISLISIGIVFWFLSIFWQQHLLQPLKNLTIALRQITKGNLDVAEQLVLPPEVKVELEQMVASIKVASRRLRKRYLQLANLSRLSREISAAPDLDKLFNLVLQQSLEIVGAKTGSIMLLDDSGQYLTIQAASGLDAQTIATTKVKIGQSISGQVAKSGKPLIIKEAQKSKRKRAVKDALCVPLIANHQVIGVINANNKKEGSFDANDLKFFITVAGQVAAAIANATLVKKMQEAYMATIKVLAAAIDAKDKYTRGHSERVARYSVLIAQELKLPKTDITRIEAAAYLHDIGKIGVPDLVLNKAGALTDAEFAIIKSHPQKAAEILAHIAFPWGDLISGAKWHHERYDGRGYPDGLKGQEIPLDARIIAVADCYDAMTSNRPYRRALSRTKAISELMAGREKQFDPKIVDTFVPALLREWMSSMAGLKPEQYEFLS